MRSVLVLVCLLAPLSTALAQTVPSRFAIDTSAAADETLDGRGNMITGATFDAIVSADLGAGFEAIVRPFAQRLTTGEWNRQIWVAAARYERRGRVGLRVDAGLIPSPVGATTLMLRPHLNPTISLPAAAFTPLPPVEASSPRTTLLGVIYPWGVNATVSSSLWDARVAVIDTSPLRSRRIFADANPPRFANLVLGGGVTPVIGLRIGASVTHGGWQRAGENPTVSADRDATVVTVEGDFSVRYTRVLAEWVRSAYEIGAGDVSSTGWFAQAQQTITPRWFAAARVERMQSPAISPLAALTDLDFAGTEAVVGYRVTSEITLRVGHRARRGFGRPEFDHVAQASVVWWKRWL